MKKQYVLFAGLFLATAAQACNMNVENCSGVFIPEINQYDSELGKNPEWQRNPDQEVVAKLERYRANGKACGTNKCINDWLFAYVNLIRTTTYKYRELAKNKAQVAATVRAPSDKWTDQCVAGKKPNVFAYADESGGVKTAVIVSEYTGYKVAKANGGQLVALSNSETGQLIGWAKKSELQMQDLRNCN